MNKGDSFMMKANIWGDHPPIAHVAVVECLYHHKKHSTFRKIVPSCHPILKAFLNAVQPSGVKKVSHVPDITVFFYS